MSELIYVCGLWCCNDLFIREGLVNRTYRKWHQKTSNRFACKKAASHLEKTLLRRMFSSWLLSRQLCSRNKVAFVGNFFLDFAYDWNTDTFVVVRMYG